MIQEITLEDCPELLQERIKKTQDNLPAARVFYVQRSDSTPYKDKRVIETSYRVFVQYGLEAAVYSTIETVGGSPLDGEVYCNNINFLELQIIATKAEWIGDELRQILNNDQS